jgi:uncharacterized protein (TIGR02145 family)
MKKLLPLLFLIIGLSLSAQNVIENCDITPIPRWGESLGKVSFATDRKWTVEGHDMTQIWSDVVEASACGSSFMGDSAFVVFFSDCRSNSNIRGSFFSWCAVARFGSTLCPAPWRVPTADDFCNLNKILFETTACVTHTTTPEKITETLIKTWGADFSGGYGSRGSLFHLGSKVYYWSQTEYSSQHAYYLDFDIHGKVQPQNNINSKALGFLLRCVR